MIGFNRRFSPFIKKIKTILDKRSTPIIASYHVNAGFIPKDSWVQDPVEGGGRIIGEVCHFVDFMIFLANSLPNFVHATSLGEGNGSNDIVNINISFNDGSIGTINYLANGNKKLAKERFEIHSNGNSAVIEDFKELNLYMSSKQKKIKKITQDKGQANMIKDVIEGFKGNNRSVMPYEHIYATSLTTIKILESIRTNEMIKV